MSIKTIRHSKLAITLSSNDTLDYEMLHAIQLNLMYDENVTCLHVAAYAGHKEIVELLIANGADVNEKDD